MSRGRPLDRDDAASRGAVAWTATARPEDAPVAPVIRRAAWRILPVFFLCYLVAYLDRVNVSFAKLQMLGDLKLSEAAYGAGAGIFFIGYCLFEIPSNLILHRVGARHWIARIMLTWGALSIAMVWVKGETSFYALRFLLGLAEAGFYPGVLLYPSRWFPTSHRAWITALFMAGSPVSGIVGGPLSGLIMSGLGGALGLAGWQWLFIVEGVPALVLAAVVLFRLSDTIEDAHWLAPSDRAVLHGALAADVRSVPHRSFGAALVSPRVWILCCVYFGVSVGSNTFGFWQPTIIKGSGVADPLAIGSLSAIPYLVALAAMLLTARHADRRQERRWHAAVPMAAAAVGLLLCASFRAELIPAILCLSLTAAGTVTSIAMFWALPPAFLGGTAAAAGIALINSIGNLGGFVSPTVMGWLATRTQSVDSGLYLTSGCLFAAAVLILAFVPSRIVNL